MKLTLIAAGAALIGLASFSAPAAAFPLSGFETARPSLVHPARFHRRKHCHFRKVVTRDRFGQRRVRLVRICR